MKFILRFFGYRRLAALAAVQFISAVLDLAGIVILFPYITLAANPADVIEKHGLQRFLDALNIAGANQFVLAVGAGLIAFYLGKAALAYALNMYQFKATAGLTHRLN